MRMAPSERMECSPSTNSRLQVYAPGSSRDSTCAAPFVSLLFIYYLLFITSIVIIYLYLDI